MHRMIFLIRGYSKTINKLSAAQSRISGGLAPFSGSESLMLNKEIKNGD